MMPPEVLDTILSEEGGDDMIRGVQHFKVPGGFELQLYQPRYSK